MASKGKITHWKRNKGFGFITPDSGAKQVFVHISEFHPRKPDPKVGDLITFSLSSDEQGRPCAVRVRRQGEGGGALLAGRGPGSVLAIAGVFLAVVGICVALTSLPLIVLGWYLALSAATFVIYAWDKNSAQRDAWRTSEASLHALSLVGGWPGALVAQQVLRHKSRKKEFRAIFWVTVILNLMAFAWLFTETGSTWVASL